MKVYVNLINDNSVELIATSKTVDTQIEVDLPDGVIYPGKMQGYEVRSYSTGELFLYLNEEKYQNYLKKEQEELERQLAAEKLQELVTMKTLQGATDAEALEMRSLYPEWCSEVEYTAGYYLQYKGILYKVLQDHTSQADWTPDKAVSLYVNVADPQEPYPPYKAPTGAHDAYKKGDCVTFEGKHYRSKIDGNVHSPAEYPAGWEIVEEED